VLKKFKENNIKENVVLLDHKTRKWKSITPELAHLPPFERVVEIPWVLDKISQVTWSNSKMFDFGCNKAEYIKEIIDGYGTKVHGIDIKPSGKNFVDKFYHGEFNADLEDKIGADGPFDVVTSISAIEHAGCLMHPDIEKITNYQMHICEFLLGISNYFFFTVPYGKRPGWAKDESRKNLHQFNKSMLTDIKSLAQGLNKTVIEEYFKLQNGEWVQCSSEEIDDSSYRGNKQGANSFAAISVFNYP